MVGGYRLNLLPLYVKCSNKGQTVKKGQGYGWARVEGISGWVGGISYKYLNKAWKGMYLSVCVLAK